MLLQSSDCLRKSGRNGSNLKILDSNLNTGNISHAYLFSGNETEFLFNLSLDFAASINCPEKGCGKCSICRNTLKQVYENLLVIEPAGTEITIDFISEIQRFMILSPRLNNYKICIIKEADTLNRDAANKLLKTLEEPPDNKSIFILLAGDPEEVIPTIASRCITFEWDIEEGAGENIKLDPYKLKEILLRGLTGVLRKSSGYNSALDLSSELEVFIRQQSPAGGEFDREMLDRYKNTGASEKEAKKFEGILRSKSRKKAKKYYSVGLNTVFDIITAWLEDVISVNSGTDRDYLNYPENYDFIKLNLPDISDNIILKLISDIEKGRSYIKYSANAELMLDSIFLNIASLVKAGNKK